MHLRLHLHRDVLARRPSAAPRWWTRIGIDHLANPLDQLIVTSELLVGASMVGVGAALVAFAGVTWPWAMVAAGLGAITIAVAALFRT